MDSKTEQSSYPLASLVLEDIIDLVKKGNGCQVDIQIHSTAEDNSSPIYSSSLNLEEFGQLCLAGIASEDSEDGIALVDRDHRILMINESFTEITGYSQQEIINQNIKILESEQKDALYPQSYAELFATQKPYSGYFFSLKKNGEFYKQKLTIKPYLNG